MHRYQKLLRIIMISCITDGLENALTKISNFELSRLDSQYSLEIYLMIAQNAELKLFKFLKLST